MLQNGCQGREHCASSSEISSLSGTDNALFSFGPEKATIEQSPFGGENLYGLFKR